MQKTNIEDIELFQISNKISGELELFNNPSQVLNNDSVYVLLNNTLKKIFLWIGGSAGVHARFIAANAAQNLQREKGLTHRIIAIDQGDEPVEFIESISPIIISDQFKK